MKPDVQITTREDIVSAMRARRRFRRSGFTIACDSTATVRYRDLLDMYLTLAGARDWRWTDSRGRSSPGHSLLLSLWQVLRDLACWPFIYVYFRLLVARLRRAGPAPRRLPPQPAALFLRTDHWFDVRSGGSVGHLAGVIGGLRALGYRLQVASSDSLVGVPADRDFHLIEPVYGVAANLPELPEILSNRSLVQQLADRWPEWQPAFIYQRYSQGNFTGVALKLRFGVPYVCEYNGSFPWMMRQWERRRLVHERLLDNIELLNVHLADLVVVVSAPMKDELVARSVPAERVLVNPNGVDVDEYSPSVDGSAVRRRLGLDGKLTIGFIGTFGKWHGAEVLADAFGRLLAARPEYQERLRLLMIGDGSTMPKVRQELARHGVEAAAVLTGIIPQEEGPAHLAACDILVAPHVPNTDGTPFFGSPTKLFEYMAMGKGIVASDLDQIGEILAHDRTAWMARPGDAESLVTGLRALVEDEPLRRRLGQAARDEVVAKYTWTEHTRKIIERLKELCGG